MSCVEEVCANAVDLMSLAGSRTIDHSTFGSFRTEFKRELEDLFRQIGHKAMPPGLVSLPQLALTASRPRHAITNRQPLKVYPHCINETAAVANSTECRINQPKTLIVQRFVMEAPCAPLIVTSFSIIP